MASLRVVLFIVVLSILFIENKCRPFRLKNPALAKDNSEDMIHSLPPACTSPNCLKFGDPLTVENTKDHPPPNCVGLSCFGLKDLSSTEENNKDIEEDNKDMEDENTDIEEENTDMEEADEYEKMEEESKVMEDDNEDKKEGEIKNTEDASKDIVEDNKGIEDENKDVGEIENEGEDTKYYPPPNCVCLFCFGLKDPSLTEDNNKDTIDILDQK